MSSQTIAALVRRVAALALLGSLCATLDARAELRVLDLTGPAEVLEMAPARDNGVWLLLSRRSRDPENPRFRRTMFSVAKVNGDWHIESERSLNDGTYAQLTAFGDGYLYVRAGPRTPADRRQSPHPPELLRTNGDAEVTLYTWPDEGDAQAVRFAPDESQRFVYVLDDAETAPNDVELLKINRRGRRIWERTVEDTDFARVAVTKRGPVIAYTLLRQTGRRDGDPLAFAVSAFGRNGRPLWQTEGALDDLVDSVFGLPSDRLVVAPRTEGNPELNVEVLDLESREWSRLSLLGPKLQFPIFSSPLPRLRVASAGVLYASDLLGAPYLSLSSFDGERLWWRRLSMSNTSRPHDCSNIDVQPSANGRLVVLVACYEPYRTLLLDVDREGREPIAPFGRCVDADPVPIVELERQLRRDFGIAVRLARVGDDTASACAPPSEQSYFRFLRSFYGALTRRGAQTVGAISAVEVTVTAIEAPFELGGYSVGWPVEDAPGTFLRYRVNPDSAEALARHVVDRAAPHVVAALAMLREFADLTGHSVWVSPTDNESVPTETFLEQMEAARREIMAQVRSLKPEELDWVRTHRRAVSFQFGPEGFWSDAKQKRPVTEAGPVILEALSYP